MTRYSARIRALEGRIAPSECPLCGGIAIDFVTIHADDPVPPAPVCEKCGKPRRQFIVHHAAEPIGDEVEVSTRVEKGPKVGVNDAVAALDNKPRTRRRQYCGPR